MHLRSKIVNGNRFWYLRQSKRVGGRVVHVVDEYLGSNKKLTEMILAARNRGLPDVEVESFHFGNIAAILAANEELGFTRLIEQVTGSRATALACLAFIGGRSEEPVSKRRMTEWYRGSLLRVLIPDMPSLTCRMYLHHMDKLTDENVKEISFRLAKRMTELGHKPTMVFFDPTNYSTEQQPDLDDRDRQLPRAGKPKDGNRQAKLVGQAVALSDKHLPVFQEVYRGNENDARLFQEVVDTMVDHLLKLGVTTEELVFIFDKGTNSTDGLAALSRKKVHFLTTLKRVQAADLLKRPMRAYKEICVTQQDEKILGFRVERGAMGVDGVIVVTLNESTRQRQIADYERAKERFLTTCADVAKRMSQPHPGRRSTVQSVTERIEDALAPKWRGVFKYHVGPTIDGEFTKFDVRGWVDKKKERALRAGFGKSVIFTDRVDWTDEKIVRAYHAKSAMEEDYHVLKDVLLMPVMPIFHWLDKRITAHAHLLVYGLLFYRWIQLRHQEKLKLDRPVPMGRLAYLLKKTRLAAVFPVGGKKAKFVLEKMEDERKELVEVLGLARFVPK